MGRIVLDCSEGLEAGHSRMWDELFGLCSRTPRDRWNGVLLYIYDSGTVLCSPVKYLTPFRYPSLRSHSSSGMPQSSRVCEHHRTVPNSSMYR